MIDNMADVQKSFTNVQDQEFVVTSTKDNSLLFSVRFVYAAHVTDFAGRCEAVSSWFFQCPEPLDSVCTCVFEHENPTTYDSEFESHNVKSYFLNTIHKALEC